ncbi:MAG TPA: AI-2E family transporter [Candidatus Brocadiia bacterium]|nr:AI-2E family transporter [Candidatus Brocadiia bacterium]
MPRSSGVGKFFGTHWEKMVLWAILLGILIVLRPFLLLIFETFLITYTMKSVVEWIVSHTQLNFKLAAVIVFTLFVGLLTETAVYIGPRFISETNHILSNFVGDGDEQAQEKVDRFVESVIREVVGDKKAQVVIGSQEYITLMDNFKDEASRTAKEILPKAVAGLLHVIKFGWEFVISLLLAIIFSFILIIDWQRITSGMQKLEKSHIRTFYIGTAPHFRAFGNILGKTIRAQAIIAACNTVLTAIGLWFFEVPNITLLSTFVFLCGFIPIFGLFISSIPILLFGAQAGGIILVLKLMAFIAGVHSLEAYVLNPKITAGFLHVHPLLVLALLLVGERFFGIWGMVLSVPVGTYVISVLTTEDGMPPDE